jgi:hypothetical protein
MHLRASTTATAAPSSTCRRARQCCAISPASTGAGRLHWRPRKSRHAYPTPPSARDGEEGPSSSSTTTSNGEDELARLMKADMERFASSSINPASSQRPGQQQQQQQQQQLNKAGEADSGGGGLKANLDRLLIADFFAVLAALAWLGAGLAERAAFGSSRLVDAWMPLWPLLWQPLIGVLMAGALVSGGAGWLASKQQGRR